LQPCLDFIRDADASINAWVQVLPQKPTGAGSLSEIPFGVKDIIETQGLNTSYGSPIYQGRIGTHDAAIVRTMRERGGVLIGKTHSAAFAYRAPAPTRNPRHLAHTPGGSSSGSAAAVAAGMVPVAVGTQTLGSVLRPASYCGITGFKPSYDRLSMDGVLPFARSLDTIGFFTHTPADMLALWQSLGEDTKEPEDLPLAAADPIPEIEPAMAAKFQHALARLRSEGVSIRSIDIAAMLARLNEATTIIMFYEGARYHRERFDEHGDELGELADLVRGGLRISTERYDEAQRFVAQCKRSVTEFFKATPVILVPAATGPAPLGLAWTGDARMNAPWTALGTPAVSIPMPVSSGLPLGLQLTADHGQDARVLHMAVRVQKVLASSVSNL
jgi:Asp-tRNA(Asn)/Glu-tRNA(Gln) amidotransferase A subunit family amidase